MSDESRGADERPGLVAGECPDGHLSYPRHRRCPDCGRPQETTVDLAGRTAEVVTWTTVHATPPGVRSPNRLAVVAFDVDGRTVRAVGGTTRSVAVGDTVRPVYVGELRDPDTGIRHAESQTWDGYRFKPVDVSG